MQKNSIVLWKRAEKNKDFDETAAEMYRVLNILQDYPVVLRPNYLTTNKKNKKMEFEWKYDTFYEELKKGVNKVGKTVFQNLGYSLSFFSSLNEYDSCGISIRVGVSQPQFVNSLIIDMPSSMSLSEEKENKMIYNLFLSLVTEYKPYWGCVSNNKLKIGNSGFMKNNIPTYLHWLNYWAEELISEIGVEFLKRLQKEGIIFLDGILRLSEKAINADEDNDVIYFNKVNERYLTGLNERIIGENKKTFI